MNSMFENSGAFAPFFDTPIAVRGKRSGGELVALTLKASVVEGGYDDIVDGALAQLAAGAAVEATPDLQSAHMDSLHLDAFLGEDGFHLLQRGGGVAVLPGASVQHQNFHHFHQQALKQRFPDFRS